MSRKPPRWIPAAAVAAGMLALTASAVAAPVTVLVKLQPDADAARLGPDARPLVPAARAARLVAQAGRMGHRAPDLSRWVTLTAPDANAARALGDQLQARGDVVSAQAVTAPPPPPPAQQCRRVPASFGAVPIVLGTGESPPFLEGFEDVRAALAMTDLPAGGDGTDVRVADVEYDWDTGHVELADRALPEPVRPANSQARNISHGTAVLSLIGGRADRVGITGLTPAATLLPVGPWNNGVYTPGGAIAAAADLLRPGDVLLIEQQSGLRGPADTGVWGASVAEAIAAASAKGVVVVLPAGNGGQDLGVYGTPATDTALMVGGGELDTADGGVLAARNPSSNTGPRIDVQGPAHAVTTANASPSYYAYLVGGIDTPGRAYTHCFNGTSSASAAVAGAIAAMQGIARAGRGTPFTPEEVRQRLVATGLAQVDPQNGHVGPLPQVSAAADLAAPPAPVITSPLPGQVGVGVVTVTWRSGIDPQGGSGNAADLVLLDDQVVAREPAGAPSVRLTLTAGPHRLVVRSSDVAGNAAESAVDLTGVDPTPSLYAVPPPPGSGSLTQLEAGRVLSARWIRATRTLSVRVRLAGRGRAMLSGRAMRVRAGRFTVRMARPGVRLVVLTAPGHRPVRIRVRVTVAGEVTLRRA